MANKFKQAILKKPCFIGIFSPLMPFLKWTARGNQTQSLAQQLTHRVIPKCDCPYTKSVNGLCFDGRTLGNGLGIRPLVVHRLLACFMPSLAILLHIASCIGRLVLSVGIGTLHLSVLPTILSASSRSRSLSIASVIHLRFV